MILLFTAALLALPLTSGIPAWLDTTPPKVTVHPTEKIHRNVFHISLTVNENATIYASIDSHERLAPYRAPLPVTADGSVTVYFYAEDDFGNRSLLDSATYVLDTRPPIVTIEPTGGVFGAPVMVRVKVNEPCERYLVADTNKLKGREIADSFLVKDTWKGYILAIDRAGNRRYAGPFVFSVDTSRIQVRISPPGGVFRTAPTVRMEADSNTTIYYSFDPLAPASWFQAYREPLALPYGITYVRFFGRHASGRESEISAVRFLVDTVAPKLRVEESHGEHYDTVRFVCKEPAFIYYALNERLPTPQSELYRLPLAVPRKGRTVIRAIAFDSAGNTSEVVRWEGRYDTTAPEIMLSHRGGSFNTPVQLSIKTSESARIFYTLDGSPPTASSFLYYGPILISKGGRTDVRCIAIDEAGNCSSEKRASFFIDTKPPIVSIRIDSDIRSDKYRVTLSANEHATIYYNIGEKKPTRSSAVYEQSLILQSGQKLQYFAVDDVGNATDVKVMDDLIKPMVAASKSSGVYAQPLRITFLSNTAADVFWRLAPDTAWRVYRDTIYIEREGVAVLEYFSRSSAGLESPRRRNEYFLDWTSPSVDVTLKKGRLDSVTVFFSCSENATIYYTVDGSNPAFSPTVRIAGNKHSLAHDRISLVRGPNVRLAYYAEDVVGNQSKLSVIELAKPRVISNIPAGRERIYSSVLSVTLTTIEERAKIYYARHGRVPTTDSLVFNAPILLTESDTILAFAIDAAGYRGEIDTFVYLIDLPPVPQFTFSPASPVVGEVVSFDAFRTTDHETPREQLLFRWDFEGDGTFDTDFSNNSVVRHSYKRSGWFFPRLEVKDRRGRTAWVSKKIILSGWCPEGMVYVADSARHHFCIDRYEWPNRARQVPRNRVTWVEAKMACFRVGKRLCTAQEWEVACRGMTLSTYPYGSQYQKGICPTEGERLHTSGSFADCSTVFGAYDMVGNVWEWVDSRQGDDFILMGGSHVSGSAASCGARMGGAIVTSSEEIGFRCCR